MSDNFININIDPKYLKRSYINNNENKWYVFVFPYRSRLYGEEVHILEKLIFINNFKIKIRVPKTFSFNTIKIKKVKGSFESKVSFKLNAEILKDEFNI